MNVSTSNSSVTAEEPWQYLSRLVLVVSTNVINYTLGLSLHSYIIRVLLNRLKRMDPSHVMTLNQAAAEIFFMLFGPFHIMLNVRAERWFYKPLGFILGMGMAVRSLLQCCVCLERYLAVVHPVTFLKFKPMRYRVGVCVMAWVGGAPSGVICMVTFPKMPYQFFGVIYLIITSISVFSCVSILMKLRHPGPGEGNMERLVEDSTKKRAFNVVLMNLLTFLVQNTPLAVLFVTLHTLPVPVFKLSIDICLTVNLAVGWVQTLFVLHRAGKF